MKRILLILCALGVLASCKSRSNAASDASVGDNTSGPYLYVKEETQDLGKIKQGDTIFCTFVVENRGKADLLIKNVVPGCGCTVAKYEQKPIAPKKSGTVNLIFASRSYSGKIYKTATIHSNAQPESKTVGFKCEIVLPNKLK